MSIRDQLGIFLDTAENAEEITQYRDPQEFMYMEGRDGASFTYAFAMYLFLTLTGKDYFEHIRIPADEYFMTIDPDSDIPVISPSEIPDEISEFSDILAKMTMYRRKSRISLKEAMEILRKMYDPDYSAVSEEIAEEHQEPVAQDVIQEEKADTLSEFEISDEINTTQNKTITFPEIDEEYDYGLILNNKRSGRIEFSRLYDCDSGNGSDILLPLRDSGDFRIGISKRHRDYRYISNPSSVYGDNIIPCAVLTADIKGFDRIRVAFERSDGKIKVSVYGANSVSGGVPDRQSVRTEIRPV